MGQQRLRNPPQDNHEASDMKGGAIDRERAVVAHDQAPEVTEPGVGAFDDPSPAVAPQRSAVLCRWSLSIAAMRHDQFDTRCRKRLRSGSLS